MKQDIKYFFGAVTDKGFVSYFDNTYDPEDSWRAFIIKGGAGTGKSSLMKRVAESRADENTVYGVCSSDPDSLDGVIFEDKKVCLLDGTAPHIVEPKCAGICETIINTGDGWDTSKLFSKREEFLYLSKKNASHHKTAARYLGAAGRLLQDNFYMQSCCADLEKARKVALSLARKKIKKGNKKRETHRFLSAVTPKGYISFHHTLTAQCDNIICVEDKWGAVGSEMLKTIGDYALCLDNSVVVCPYPLLSKLVLECVIIPSQRIGFVLSKEPLPFASRTLHTSRFCNKDAISTLTQKLKFNKKAADTLIGAAANSMKEAKAVHDDMERIFIDSMDFSVVEKQTEKVISLI